MVPITILKRCRICLDIVHVRESWHRSRSRCSAIFKYAVVNHQPTFPTEDKNPPHGMRICEASLLWPGHPYPFISKHSSSSYEGSLVRLHKNSCSSKGPRPWAYMPLADTASSRSCYQSTNDIGHESSWASWDDKGESTCLYKPTSYPLCFLDIKAWTYMTIPILSEDGRRRENNNRDGSDRRC